MVGYNKPLWCYITLRESEREHRERVNTDPDVNQGDIIVYKINNYTTIKQNTTYSAKIRANYDFNGSLWSPEGVY